MADPLEFISGYISPLTDKQHAQLGRIAVLWGQIEYFVESLLPVISGLSWDQLAALAVTEKPIGSKVDFLGASGKAHSDPAIRERVRQICGAINDTKAQRNHAFHGVWGLRGDERTKTVEPAARKTSAPNQPFRASQMGALEKKLCRCSRLAADLVWEMNGETERSKFSRFIHHNSCEPVPSWLQQWSARNPSDHESLDRHAKANQLPRPDAPYPQT